jgi:hypothetical protein
MKLAVLQNASWTRRRAMIRAGFGKLNMHGISYETDYLLSDLASLRFAALSLTDLRRNTCNSTSNRLTGSREAKTSNA